jgi:ketosteroid isomerase-like protein
MLPRAERDTARAMSEENVEVVRQPMAVRAHSRRRLEERLGLRFPGAVALVARAVWMLPTRSRLRQAIIRRYTRAGLEATNRGDFEAAFMLHHPDIELIAAGTFITLGYDPVYHGIEERIRFQERWHAEWGEFRFEAEELIDLGDRVLVVGRVKGSGLSSGVAVDNDWTDLLTIFAGRVISEQVFFDQAKALEAAGLSE